MPGEHKPHSLNQSTDDYCREALAEAAGRPEWLRAAERGLIADAWIGHDEPLSEADMTTLANAVIAGITAGGYRLVRVAEGPGHPVGHGAEFAYADGYHVTNQFGEKVEGVTVFAKLPGGAS